MTKGNDWPDSMDAEGVVADCGPLHILIKAWRQNQLDLEAARMGARKAIDLFNDVVQNLPIVKQKSCLLRVTKGLPPVVGLMIDSSKMTCDPDITPMAAVAGAIADLAADYVLELGADKVIAENGGDIAVRVPAGDKISIGIRTDVASPTLTHAITVTGEMNVGGVCTSGLGGRSFTLGIASAAMAMSTSGALADSAATLLGNSTLIDSPKIKRCLAEEIDPNTDIRGLMVVTHVDPLTPEEIEESLRRAKQRALEFTEKQVIKGSFIVVQGRSISTGLGSLVYPLDTASINK